MSLENSPSFLLNFSECEMPVEDKHFYRFKSYRLDVEERQLLHDGDTVPLTPKAFDVLAVLVENSGHLVEKDELLRTVWADSFVEEANVARIVHTLRKVLGEDDNGNKFIETVARKGYRFVAEVDEVREPTALKTERSEPSAVADGLNSTTRNTNSNDSTAKVQPSATADSSGLSPQLSPKITETAALPEKKTNRIVLFSVGFVTAVSLVILLSFNYHSKTVFNPDEVRSIAVLPLKPLSPENRNAGYELGIAEALIYKISSGKNLTVRSMSATEEYVDSKKTALAIGKEQQVDLVLASNYEIADGKIRVTSELINVANGVVEDSYRDEQPTSNSFAVQDAITANIGQKLLTKLNREPNNRSLKHYTTNEEASRLYWQATVLANKRQPKNAEKAIEYFEKAVELDPNYAPAYAGLANAHTSMATIAGQDTHEQYLKAKSAIEKALAIDDNLAEAHSYSGEIKWVCEWDFAGAEREHKRAIELNPNSSAAHRMYALYLGSMKRLDEAVAEIKTAVDLEPALGLNQRIYGQILYYDRRPDEAIARFKQTLEMDSDFNSTCFWLIGAYRAMGDDDQAFEWFVQLKTKSAANQNEIESWKTIYAQSGWRGINERQFAEAREAEKNGKPNYGQLANLSIDLGERDQAFDYLEKTFDKRQWMMTTLNVNPRYDLIRSDPRFEDLVKRVGLE